MRYLDRFSFPLLFQEEPCGAGLSEDVDGGIERLTLTPEHNIIAGPPPCHTPGHNSVVENKNKSSNGWSEQW